MLLGEPNPTSIKAELSTSGFFRVDGNGNFQKKHRILKLLNNPKTGRLVLNELGSQYVSAGQQRDRAAEHNNALNLLRAITLVGETTPDPELRGVGLLHLARFISMRDSIYAAQGEAGERDYDQPLVKQHIRLIDSLSNLPEERSTTGDCAYVHDAIANGLQLTAEHDGKSMDHETATLIYMSRHMRARFAKNYLGREPNPLEFGEYGIDAALQARQPIARSALMAATAMVGVMRDPRIINPFLSELKRNSPRLSEELNQTISKGLYDRTDVNHDSVMRMMRKQLLIGDPPTTINQLIHWATQSETTFDAGSMRTPDYGKVIDLVPVQERMVIARTLVAELFGESGRTIFARYLDQLRGHVPYRDRIKTLKQLQQQSHWRKATLFEAKTGKQQFRAVEGWKQDTVPSDHLPMTELPEYNQRPMEEYTTAMINDIKESTVALGDTRTDIQLPGYENKWVLYTKSLSEKPFPACELRLIGEKDMIDVELDDNLQFLPPLADHIPRLTQQALEVCRRYAIASLHDHLAYNHVITTEPRLSPAPDRPRPETAKSEKPPRVQRLKNLIVVPTGKEADHTALSVQQDPTTAKGEVTLMVDRKPHWADMAPELTLQARGQVFADLARDGLLATCNDEQHALLHTALTGPNTHLLSARRIITELFQQRTSEGKSVLPPMLSKDELMQRFEQYEEEYYAAALLEQESALEERSIRLPTILPIMRKDRSTGEPKLFRASIGQRIAENRAAMIAAGVTPQIPDRQRPTQTYVPWHRMATIPLTQSVTRKRNYIIIRADSAVQALTALLQEQATAK